MTSWTKSFRGKRWLLGCLCCCAVTVTTDNQVEFQCPNLDKGTQRVGACGCTMVTIYTNTSKGPIDQASELVNALRAERLMKEAE
jgi:hypothetical protein